MAQWVGAAAAIVAILGGLVRVLGKLEAQARRFDETRALALRNDETGKLLLRACIAILDGLGQQGCNGTVKQMHEALIRHAVDK